VEGRSTVDWRRERGRRGGYEISCDLSVLGELDADDWVCEMLVHSIEIKNIKR